MAWPAQRVRPLGGLAWLVLAVSLTACATASSPSRVPIEPVIGATESGEASWYGPKHQGRRTSSGEPFDMHKLTAAHPTLPLGTRVLVTNLRNGRSVQVLVNDRGPGAPGRIIDLSYAAAEALGYLRVGLVPVRIQVLSLPGDASRP